MTTERKRLSPDESRAAALAAAYDILLADGPQAVTLKAVAGRIGRTHANLLHHFGSALELQKALAAMLAERVCASIADTVVKARRGAARPIPKVSSTGLSLPSTNKAPGRLRHG